MIEKQPQESQPLPGIHLGETAYLPDDLVEGLDERQDVLDLFSESPRDTRIWNYVADKTLEEEMRGTGQPEGLKDVSAHALIEFAHAIYDAEPEDRYALTTRQAPNGELWFDVLYGFHGSNGNMAIANAVTKQLRDLGQDNVERAVDLGTGTGETAEMVAPHASHMAGVDKEAALLQVAQERHPDTRFIEGDVRQLPFGDNSADIVTSNGLKYTLGAESSRQMYAEVARVLKDGGVYIDADWVPANEIVLNVHPFGDVKTPDSHPEELLSFVTWRAVLQDMVVDTVSGKFEKTGSMALSGQEWETLKLNLGLYEETHQLQNGFSSKLAKARLLYKDAAKAYAHDREYSAMIRRMIN